MTKARRIIASWVNTNINASPVSRDVAAINHLNRKLDVLEKALVEAAPELGAEDTSEQPAAPAGLRE